LSLQAAASKPPRVQPRWLLAVDLDGTLLRNDKSIAPEDLAAIRAAPAHGIAVTIATGRLLTGTLPIARELALSTPLVCADGGLMVEAETGATLHRIAISVEHAQLALDAMLAHGLVPYVLCADAIHCERSGECHRSYVDAWTKEIVTHASLAAAAAWRTADGVSMTVGIGTRDAVEKAYAHFCSTHAQLLDTVYFHLGDMTLWAVRSLPRGCDKGEMLARLAARLDLPRTRVAAVGDWFNDVGMFKYAGRSFAMGHAPDYVREAATDTLRATSATGGGVAAAIEALISSDPT
jgi:Cof subfamily protein (haloacid dehalogenase superfamily)